MKILKAKLKKTSKAYRMGLNAKKKEVWLVILDFKPKGSKNYLIQAVEGFVKNEPIFKNIWVAHSEIRIKQFEDGQLKLFNIN